MSRVRGGVRLVRKLLECEVEGGDRSAGRTLTRSLIQTVNRHSDSDYQGALQTDPVLLHLGQCFLHPTPL